MEIEYESEDFANEARKMVSSGRAFQFLVRGSAKAALEPHLEGGKVNRTAELVVDPILGVLAGVLIFAEAKQRRVLIERGNDAVVISVGGDA